MKLVRIEVAALLGSVGPVLSKTVPQPRIVQSNHHLVRRRSSVHYDDRNLSNQDNIFDRLQSESRERKSFKKNPKEKRDKGGRSPLALTPVQAPTSDSPTRAPLTGFPVQRSPTIQPITAADNCLDPYPGCEETGDALLTSSPSITPSASAPSVSPLAKPSLTPSIRPSKSPVALIAKTTIVTIQLDPLDDPSFQEIIDAASLLCDQIGLQTSILVPQAAPLIVGNFDRCSILRDSDNKSILLEIEMSFAETSVIIPADSERADLICFTITGDNFVSVLKQFRALGPSNSFASASSILCSLKVDTDAPSVKPTPWPTTTRPTVTSSREPTDSPTKVPTDVPSKKPTSFPSGMPTDGPTKQRTDSPSTKPTLQPTLRQTITHTQFPSTKPVALSPVPSLPVTSAGTGAPITSSPSNSPIQVQLTRVPTVNTATGSPRLSPTVPPSRNPITLSPSLSPKALTEIQIPSTASSNSPTKPPTSRPVISAQSSDLPIAIVPATQFTIEYSIASIIAFETQDFDDAARATCEYIRTQMVQTFISVETLLCTPARMSEFPLFIQYDMLIAFNGISAATPTTSSIDVSISKAFNQPNVQDLISSLQNLSEVNPFSTTTSVVYSTT
jgi:hypothetical protein